MGPVIATERYVEGLEVDPVGFGCVSLRLLDLGDEARVHEFLPLLIGVGKPGVQPSIGRRYSGRI
jgi:hypothetical protein